MIGFDTSRRAAALLVVWLVVAGCASATSPVPAPPSPAALPSLEARLTSEPDNEPLRVLVAAGHRDAGRPMRAAALLEPVAAGGAGSDAAVFLLGLVYEDQSRFADARRLYRAFEDRGGPLAGRARERLALIGRLELQQAVRASLAQEQMLRGTPPAARSVGVFPFLFAGDDEQLQPLSRAMAEMLTTDLAQTDRLTVLERAQVQMLIDELDLASSGYVDTTTAARAGHLLGAGRIVQGRIGGGQGGLEITAAVVPVASAAGVSPLRQAGALQTLFDMEKALALEIYQAMGIQLTAAEQQRVEQRQTSNVQALLAFGYGLDASDAGRAAEAAAHFERAVQLDPQFTMARERLDRARLRIAASQASGPAATRIAVAVLPPDLTLLSVVDPFAPLEAMVPSPLLRDPGAEVFGVEGLDRRPVIDVIIRPPAGGGS